MSQAEAMLHLCFVMSDKMRSWHALIGYSVANQHVTLIYNRTVLMYTSVSSRWGLMKTF